MASLTPSLPWNGAGPAVPVDRQTLPAWARLVLLILTAYLAVPVLEVPLFGLSLSAPLFCLVALECLLRPVAWPRYRRWILLAALFWSAQLLSLTANVMSGNLTEISAEQARLLARFAFWLLVFVVTMLLVHRYGLGPNLCKALAAGALVLGLLRLCEAAAFGYWGGGNPRFLSQNDYGFGFSAFTPFATWLVAESRGWKRLPVLGAWLALLCAVIGNGSRSSWITVALGFVLFVLLAGLARGARFLVPCAMLVLLAVLPPAALRIAPAALRDPVVERGSSLSRLDRDKPFQARRLLVRKGLLLFQQNPLFGVGVGGFTQTLAPVEIPSVLSYSSIDEFNRKSPHNSYVKVLAESGLFGAISLFGLLTLLAWRGLPAALAGARGGESWGIAVFVGFVAMCVHFWTLSGLTGTAPWFVCGMLAGLIERRRSGGSALIPRA